MNVKLITMSDVREGYGSHRLASMLNSMGIRTHNGSQFQCNTVNRILRNRSYCGYYISGEIVSPHLPNLQIIDEDIYDKAQKIMTQRSAANEQKTEKEHRKLSERLLQLTVEISKSLTGENKYTPDMLSMAIENAKVELQRTEDMRVQLNYRLNNNQGAMKKLDHYYEQFRSWAEEFEDADLAERKMIICQLIREINVSKGYELDVVLDLNYEQFLSA